MSFLLLKIFARGLIASFAMCGSLENLVGLAEAFLFFFFFSIHFLLLLILFFFFLYIPSVVNSVGN